ncbi:hypothetical protein ABZ511_20155 [Nocardia gamkensis]|uniref:hypothetical protein n=1 Tax=Nocardia gamkensis TaxID=352869 RepID=UPI0034019756
MEFAQRCDFAGTIESSMAEVASLPQVKRGAMLRRPTRCEENVRRVGEVAKLFADAGVVAVVPEGQAASGRLPFGFPDSSLPASWIGYPLRSRYTKPASGDISVIGSDTSVER